MNAYFDLEDTIYNIVNEYPFILELLIEKSIINIDKPDFLETLGKKITVKAALKAKGIDASSFEELLVNCIEEHKNNSTVSSGTVITVDGVLPCPIRIPLEEKFEEFIEENKDRFTVKHNLKSANMGIDDIVELCKKNDINAMPDIILSAGFQLFFDKNLMGQYFEKNYFKLAFNDMNRDFDNDYISLIDPKSQYVIGGVVPAVFIVNKKELGTRAVPETWKDLLSETYTDSVGIPMMDLDIFNALLINIYKLYGMEGIKSLARIYHKELHPSEMADKNKAPAISIAPYFFSQILCNNQNTVCIWPKDGAIISPIFLVAKSDKKYVHEVASFFLRHEVGKIMSANGKFPSTHRNVDNHLCESQKFIWLGWDYIYSHDISKEIDECGKMFYQEIEERK